MPPLRRITLCSAASERFAHHRPFLETDAFHFRSSKLASADALQDRPPHSYVLLGRWGLEPGGKHRGRAREGPAWFRHHRSQHLRGRSPTLLERGLMREDGQPVDDFLIIPGVEVTTAEGHLLCIGATLPTPRVEGQAGARGCGVDSRARRARHSAASVRSFSCRDSFQHARDFTGRRDRSFQRRHHSAALQSLRIQICAVAQAAHDGGERRASLRRHRHRLHDFSHGRFFGERNTRPDRKSTELNQHYMTPKDSLRKTWNNWMRLRRKNVYRNSREIRQRRTVKITTTSNSLSGE